MAETDVGILIKAVDQATAILRVVSDEVRKLEVASGKAAIATSSFSKSQIQLGAALDAVRHQLARHSPALAGLSDVFDAVGKASVGAGGAIAGASVAVIAIGAAAVVAANSIGHYQERMDLAAQATGLTQGQIGGLTVAASNVGRSFESIQPSLTIFSRKIFEARAGSKDLETAFATLSSAAGHTIDVNASVSDLFGEVAQSINKIPDPADRAKVAFELFGRSGIQMLGILSQDLTEAEKIALRLGITLSADMQKVARDADAAGDRLKLTFTGLGNTIMLALAPVGTLIENSINMPLAKLAVFLNSPEWKAFTSAPAAFSTPLGTGLLPAVGPSDEELDVLIKALTIPPSPSGGLSRIGMVGDLIGKEAFLTKEQKDQLEVVEKLIARQAELVTWGAIKLDQEIKTLEASRSNVLSKRELNELESKINALKAQQLALEKAAAEVRVRGLERETFVTPEARKIFGPQVETFALPPFRPAISEAGGPAFTAQTGAFNRAIKEVGETIEETKDRIADSVRSLRDDLRDAAKSIDVAADAAFAFARAAGRAASDVILHGKDIVKAFGDIMNAIAEAIITGLAEKVGLKIADVVVGVLPFLFQSGGTLAHVGGMVPLRAQSGVILPGIRGFDTVPLMAGRGETVLSHDLTDNLKRFLSQVSNIATRSVATESRPDIQVHPGAVQIQGGIFDANGLRDIMTDSLAKAFEKATASGRVR